MKANAYLTLARQAGKEVTDSEEKKILLDDLATI